MPIGGEIEHHGKYFQSSYLPSVVLQKLKKFGNATFLVDGLLDTTRTFTQVLLNAVRYALALRKRNVTEGAYVAFLTDTSIDTYELTIGVWLAGGCVCPMHPSLLPGEVRQLLEISAATFVYCDNSSTALFEEAKKTLGKSFTAFTNGERDGFISLSSLLAEHSPESEDIYNFSPNPCDPDDHITCVLFTSGTTGVPKGVMLSSYATLLAGSRTYESEGPILLTTPFCWFTNPASFVNSILTGDRLIFPRIKLLPGTDVIDPYHIPKTIEKYKPKKWSSLPSSTLSMCYLPAIGDYDFSSLEHFGIGGSAISAAKKKFICDTLFKGKNKVQERYGSTETGYFTTEWRFPPPDFEDPKYGSFGPPCPGVEAKVVDMETGKELGPNQVGELFIRTNAIMKGYINKDMPQRYTKNDWYDMGDMVYYDEDGWVYFKTRSKELLEYRGHLMAPVELESILLKHADVLEACVVGAPHPIDVEWPTAFVVKRENSSLTEQELQSFFNDQVGDEKKLRGGVFFKDSLPVSNIGKLIRRALKEEANNLLQKL